MNNAMCSDCERLLKKIFGKNSISSGWGQSRGWSDFFSKKFNPRGACWKRGHTTFFWKTK
jgi:hypothetical protein